MHIYNIIMQNGRILILIVLDKTNTLLGHSLHGYYALDSITILNGYYASIVQWLQQQI